MTGGGQAVKAISATIKTVDKIADAGKVVKAADKVADVAKTVDKIDDVTSTAKAISEIGQGVKAETKATAAAYHSNSLKTTKPAIGYELVDKQSGAILKYGETTRGTKRYTNKYYEETNSIMKPMASGTKKEMHNWQHEQIINYTSTYNQRPPLNKSNW